MNLVLILGGYGGFGGRLSRRLAGAGYEVLVAGRDPDRARRFCSSTPNCRPVQADRNNSIVDLLARLRPDLVIDAAGPFQDSDYRVPRACIAAGTSYLDLADGRAFVVGISTLDAEARAAGVAVVAGASSVPALSGAVVRYLCRDLPNVTSIEMAISASNRATAGRSVSAAILSYVGKPIRLWQGKDWTIGFGWQSLRQEVFALTGGPSLGRRWVALADVPDLELLPSRLAGRPAVTFRAGTELVYQNFLLWLASWLVRCGALRSLRLLGGLLQPIQRLTARLGGDRSGMLVRIFGLDGSRRVERRWTLIADHGKGPEIPTLAAAILAEQILGGRIMSGAYDAGEALSLDQFADSFAAISTRTEICEYPLPPPLYARVMGDDFERLAPAVAQMHTILRDGGAKGRAIVMRGRNLIARAIAAIMRFPPAGEHKVHVAFTERGGVETWTRKFSGTRFSSRLSQRGRYLIERFGLLRFRFSLLNEGNGLRMVMRGWSFAGLPLPLWLAPQSEAREWQDEDRFHFDVPIVLPLVGLIVHYRGWLKPADQTATE